MNEKFIGRVALKTPVLCICCVKIDGMHKTLNPLKRNQKVDLPYGKYSINIGITYEYRSYRSQTVWAWGGSKTTEVNEKDIVIEVKRTLYLFKPPTVKAEIKIQ